MQPYSVLLVPSDNCGWSELRRILVSMAEVDVIGEATTPDRALHLAGDRAPAAIISAPKLAGMSTLPLLAALRRRVAPTSTIMVIGERVDPQELPDLAAIGIAGHLLWNDLSPQTLRLYVAAVILSGMIVASREVVEAFMAGQGTERSRTQPPMPLNDRERAVLCRLAEGLTHDQIARTEFISRRTVERIIGKLETKLDAPTQYVLGRNACRMGLHDGLPSTQSRL